MSNDEKKPEMNLAIRALATFAYELVFVELCELLDDFDGAQTVDECRDLVRRRAGAAGPKYKEGL